MNKNPLFIADTRNKGIFGQKIWWKENRLLHSYIYVYLFIFIFFLT